MIAALALSALLAQAPAEAAAIQLGDDAITAPSTVPSGLISLSIANSGAAPHDLRFVKINGTHTIDQFKAWKESGKPIPEWLVSSGGIGAIVPGMTIEYAATLEPGTYVAMSDDTRFAALRVLTARRPPAPSPEADVTVRLHDHGFQLTAPVPAGRPLFRVENTGSEPHQMLIVRLQEGANEYQQRAWISAGRRGPSPAEQYGGVLELAPGAHAWFRAPLKAGRYLLICGEQEQEGRHFDLGMIYRFEIE